MGEAYKVNIKCPDCGSTDLTSTGEDNADWYCENCCNRFMYDEESEIEEKAWKEEQSYYLKYGKFQ